MATGVSNSVKKEAKIPVYLTYEGKQDEKSILDGIFSEFVKASDINGEGIDKLFFGDNYDVLLYLLNNG